MTSTSLLAAIAEVCRWHSKLTLMDLYRALPGGRREPIIPTEIPSAIEKGEIEVPHELMARLEHLVLGFPDASIDSISAQRLDEEGKA